MAQYWLPVLFLAMQAGWVSAACVPLAHLLAAGDRHGLLPLPLTLATLLAAYTVARRLEVLDGTGTDEAGMEERGGGALSRASAGALALGVTWTVGGVWLARHAGEGPGWMAALPLALASAFDKPSLDAASLLGVFALWWRGVRTAALGPTHGSTVRAFGTGALVLAAALLLSIAIGAPPAAIAAGVLVFLGAGLPALSLARLQELRADLEAGAVRGEAGRLDAAWWRSLLPPVAAVLGVSGIAGLLFSGAGVREAAAAAGGGVMNLLLGVLYWPFVLVGLLVELAVTLLRQAARPQQSPEAAAEPGDFAKLLEELRQGEHLLLEPPDWLRWVLLAGAAGLVFYAFLRSARARGRERTARSAAGTRRESLGAWGALWRDLSALVGSLVDRFKRRTGAVLSAVPLAGIRGGGDARMEHAADARASYRRMLALGREHALARRPAQTPGEYLEAWRGTLPGTAEASKLTDAYVHVRYAAPADAPGGTERRVSGWLRSTLRSLEQALRTARR